MEPKGASVREGDSGWIPLRCEKCGENFLRSKTCDFKMIGEGTICIECFVVSSLGESCDILILKAGNSFVCANRERFVFVARSTKNGYWYALDREGHSKIFPPGTMFAEG